MTTPPGSMPGRAHSARVYDYWLGGKDNFAADRDAAEEAISANPGIVADARANRAFLARSVRYLASERGVSQFLDIGTGLPAASNTHEVAQSADPTARVVYVDNDPVVLTHARALMVSGPAGRCDYVDADLRDQAGAGAGGRGSARRVTFADGTFIDAHTVILATGVSYRRLGAPGLDEMTGRGVYYGSALTEATACDGQDIYVVGGANSAGQAAVYLARFAKSVTILVRGPSLEKSMSYYLIRQIADIPNITVRTCTEVTEAAGEGHLERLTLRDTATGATENVDAQMLFLFIGAAPLTDWLNDVVIRDARGFVVAGPDLGMDRPPRWDLERMPYHLETSVPGVFVAGDARSESAKRVASAVGEGALAVMLVHRYLEKS